VTRNSVIQGRPHSEQKGGAKTNGNKTGNKLNGGEPARGDHSQPSPSNPAAANGIKTHPDAAEIRVPQRGPYNRIFRRVGPGHFVATLESDRPEQPHEQVLRTLKRVLIGPPLETAEEIHQRLTKVKALAVFGSDAMSSSAYATEATLFILMAAGNEALGISVYTALAVALMLATIAFSYRQTVYAYPQGGGTYRVSSENLGQLPGLTAAAALLIDYVLTVAVSIVAGAAAVTSALTASGWGPQLHAMNAALGPFLNVDVLLSLFFIGVIMLGNLRGIRESGTIFAVPTYAFIVSLAVVLVVGLFKALTGTLTPAEPPPLLVASEPLSLWLVLKAFSAGAVAMSGTEAIADGVPAFQKPESRNAATTLTVMATLLGVFFLGVSFLATHMGLVPQADETIVSQIARAVLGTGFFYYIFQIATMGILVVAANTAFADFPRLSSILARDNYMSHNFMFRGDRLAFSTGIMALGLIASILIVVFRASVDSLIHLYAVGVLLAFTLSNSGMVVHWWKTRGPNWKTSLPINATGAILSATTLAIVAITKFALGAWIVVLLIPVIVVFFLLVHRHYSQVAAQLHVDPEQLPPATIDQIVLVPIDNVNYASLRALAFARTIARKVIVLHVSTDPARAEKIRQKIDAYASDVRLVIIDSPYRTFIRPLLAYVDFIHGQRPDAFVTIVLPEFIPAHWWERFLHNQTAARLRSAFELHPNVAVVLVPYLLES
jgi:amino acid transporter